MHMQNLQFIKRLVIDRARYQLSDERGNTVTLMVDYKNNTYSIKNTKNITGEKFNTEVQKLARGLLARKHGTNLANKEHYI